MEPLDTQTTQEEPSIPPQSKNRKVPFLITGGVLAVLLLVIGVWLATYKGNDTDTSSLNPTSESNNNQQAQPEETAEKTVGLALDTTKNYGNKYADGLLPVGDNKYSSEAKQGYIYACDTYATNLKRGGGGAGVRGSWFKDNNTKYDIDEKASVSGRVNWKAEFSIKSDETTRTIVTNGLPSHTTGVFPISSSDLAYAYDRNPNSIKGQTATYKLPLKPNYGQPNCMGGEVGIMLSGIPIYNGFDAGGRDAGAWEVQDDCDGHPQNKGVYHYHTLSSCITDVSVGTVIGYALDGFPVTGPKVSEGNILTTTDLDECHGITSRVLLDGKLTTTYHYVMTQDFPYSVSCFRSKPTK